MPRVRRELVLLMWALGVRSNPWAWPPEGDLPEELGRPSPIRRAATVPQAGCSGAHGGLELLHNLTSAPYDRRIRPNSTGAATIVEVAIYFSHITEVNDRDMKIGVSGYSRAWWTDHRLAYDAIRNGGCFDEVNVPEVDSQIMWQPDLYFDNSLSEMTGAGSLKLYPTGQVYRSNRITNMFECKMHFGGFPFDTQTCRISLASYSHTANEIFVKPFDDLKGVKVMPGLCGTPGWNLESVASETEQKWYGEPNYTYPWTFAHLDIKLKRHSEFYLREYVVKAIFFVVSGWSGFFLSPKAAPARVSLAVIPLLTIITLTSSIYASLPKIEYWTWMTCFLMLCTFYCAVPVFEFALVSWLLHVEEKNLSKLTVLRSFSCLDVTTTFKHFQKMADDRAKASQSIFGFSSQSMIGRSFSCIENFMAAKKRDSGMDCRLGETSPESAVSATNLGASGVVTKEVEINIPQEPLSSTVGVSNDGTFEALGLSTHQLMLMTEGWELLDIKHCGTVSQQQMRLGMRHFGLYFSQSQIDELFFNLGLKHGEHMDKECFLRLLANYDKIQPSTVIVRRFRDEPPSNQLEVVMRWVHLITFLMCLCILSIFRRGFSSSAASSGQCPN